MNKNTLDRYFSKYIRLRDADKNGYCRCCSCGKIVHWKDCDAGHYVNRRHNGTRYYEKNVHAQCRACNRFDEGNGIGYSQFLLKKYGEGIFDELMIKKNSKVKLGQFEINQLGEIYLNKLKMII